MVSALVEMYVQGVSTRKGEGNYRGAAWLRRIDGLKGDSAVRDIQNLPDDGHLYAAHVINDLWRLTGGNALAVTWRTQPPAASRPNE